MVSETSSLVRSITSMVAMKYDIPLLDLNQVFAMAGQDAGCALADGFGRCSVRV